MVLNGDFHLTLNFLQFKQTVHTLIRRRFLRRLIWVCTVCECPCIKPSPGFTDIPLYKKKSDATVKRIARLFITITWISLVNDNHVDNNRKEILVNVYFGSIVKK